MSQRLEQRLRGANPVPNPSDPPSGAWTAEVALLEIERRSDSVQTIDRETRRTGPSGPKRNRGWLLAAAVAAAVVLIGAVVIGLQSDSGTDVVEPTPTTLSAPTTAPPPATTTPVTTAALPAQAYDATLTWDGETCSFEGPAEARVGDTLNLTGVNLVESGAAFWILYMVTGTTIEDVNDEFDNVLANVLPPRVEGDWSYPTTLTRTLSPPEEYVLVRESERILPGAIASIRADSTPGSNEATDEAGGVVLRQPREHFFVCSSEVVPGSGLIGADRVIDNALQTIKVTG